MLDVSEIQQSSLNDRHDAQQPALALEQRQPRQVLAFDAENIERVEERPLAPEQQRFKVGAAVRVQAADLAVQPGAIATKAQQ